MLISFGGISVSLLFLIMPLTFFNSTIHSGHVGNFFQSGSTSIANLENEGSLLREGDAKSAFNLEINGEYEDSDKSCHMCTNIVYKPGKDRYAALAYGGDPIDLRPFKRVVFFLMGAEGDEKVTVLIAGKKTNNLTQFSENNLESKIPGIKFAYAERVTLSKDWTRYEINIKDLDSKDTIYPVGIVLDSENSSKIQSIFLKGITIDDKPGQTSL